VDDVVAHGVGVISTREGTYLPITVLSSLLPSCAHHARIYPTLSTTALPPPPPPRGPRPLRDRFIYSSVSVSPVSRWRVRESARNADPLHFCWHPNLYGDTGEPEPRAFVIRAATIPCYPRNVADPRSPELFNRREPFPLKREIITARATRGDKS